MTLFLRNALIRVDFRRGATRDQLAQQHNLTRGQINRILRPANPPRYISPGRRRAAVRMYRKGASLADVAVRYGVWRSTVSRWVNGAA